MPSSSSLSAISRRSPRQPYPQLMSVMLGPLEIEAHQVDVVGPHDAPGAARRVERLEMEPARSEAIEDCVVVVGVRRRPERRGRKDPLGLDALEATRPAESLRRRRRRHTGCGRDVPAAGWCTRPRPMRRAASGRRRPRGRVAEARTRYASGQHIEPRVRVDGALRHAIPRVDRRASRGRAGQIGPQLIVGERGFDRVRHLVDVGRIECRAIVEQHLGQRATVRSDADGATARRLGDW